MKEVEDEECKYLGVFESVRILNRQMKEKITKEYLKRVKCLAKSRLYAGNLIRSINSWAVSVIRYTAGYWIGQTKNLNDLI